MNKQEGSPFRLSEMQSALAEAEVDGWLFYDFRGLDPIARRVLGLDPVHVGTRRWFYFVPTKGEPAKLVHRIEQQALASLPGRTRTYLSWDSLREGLRLILGDARAVAMQYSPENEVPSVSTVDAGTVELVRALGAEVVSSADFVQLFDCVLSPAQIDSHRRAAAVLRKVVDEVFAHVSTGLRGRRTVTERSVLAFIESRLADQELVCDHPPIVAVNAHAADPHFEVPLTGSATVDRGSLLLVDMWAKERRPGSIYADITWTAFAGSDVPADMLKVFTTVKAAREAAINAAADAFRSGAIVRGCELDRAARSVIENVGFGEYFIHRTGHSIHEETHGSGANLDDLETHDTRRVLPGTLFSVEPGIYLPGRFGIRSEVNVYHAGKDAEVTGPPRQDEIVRLLP